MTEATATKIRPRERDAIIQSIRAGVVPRMGQQHIQVGRYKELNAVIEDIDRVVDGGSTMRYVIGEYGAGKTFFLMLVRAVALEKRLVTIHADLDPGRRLQGTGGQARSLYTELIRNLATRAKPDGGALPSVVERFVTSAAEEASQRSISSGDVIAERFTSLREMVGGFDFASVIKAYSDGFESGNGQLQSDALRWLRGEFSTKTEARTALGVRTIIDDANWYDHLKLLARFVRLAGYAGLLVCLDELVNLYKLANSASRSTNYEQLLRILNDSLQGTAVGLGWLLGGTPQFLMDTRRGLYSYPALQSRLAENTFATPELVDYSGPVLRLSSLSIEDLYVLLTKIRNVYAGGDPARYLVPDDALTAFMERCSSRIGDAYFRSPRNTVTKFADFLVLVEQYPERRWADILEGIEIRPEANPDLVPLPDEPVMVTATPTGSASGASGTGPSANPSPNPSTGSGDDGLRTFKL